MSKPLYFIISICTVVLSPVTSFPQYAVIGDAIRDSCNCYTLTTASQYQTGAVWQQTPINLNNSFDFSFKVFLGCTDSIGADGIAFVLQQSDTAIGIGGEGLGFGAISPSVEVSLDNYQNTDSTADPWYDHITIQENGVFSHFEEATAPIPILPDSSNVEDCAWHTFRIKWDAVTHTLSGYFDGLFRVSKNIDLVPMIFGNNPAVYWGFTGTTGYYVNIQKFCTPLRSGFSSNMVNDTLCTGTPVILKDSSESFTTIKSYFWDFGDGITSTETDPSSHNYAQPGNYEIKHTITAADNCVSDVYTKTIAVGDQPVVSFQVFDSCQVELPRLEVDTALKAGSIDQWKWELNNTPFSNEEKPDISKLAPGDYTMTVTAASNFGCVSDLYTKDFTIQASPLVTFAANDGCVNAPVLFTPQQTDNYTTIKNWYWDFGDKLTSDQKDIDHIYTDSGNYPVRVTATATNGCIGSFSNDIFINSVNANAGNDTAVVVNTNFQLNGSGGSIYTWSPPTGLSNPNIANPVAKLSDDMQYLLTVKTAEGCTDTASVKIRVFKGASVIYVPNAFTPNEDGLNDILRPYCIGIKSLVYFIIYNRWGQKMYSTGQLKEGWDGFYHGSLSSAGNYVWILKAIDTRDNVYNLKGSFLLIK